MTMPHDPNLLKTQTKAALQKLVPEKLAPATTQTFSIVVLSCDFQPDHDRHVHAYERVLSTSRMDAEFQSTRKPPFVLKQGLSVEDALLAQFELVCGDIVSAFISDSVVSHAEPSYLAELYRSLVVGEEFDKLNVCIHSIPETESGVTFVHEFIGPFAPDLPHTMIAMRKKARIMQYWAKKIGLELEVVGQ